MAKAGKQEIARARATLTQERLRLKEDRLALEREWAKLDRVREAISRERAEAVGYLRILCERWGDNEWPDDLPLKEILELHFADPLADGLDKIRRRVDGLQRALRQAQTVPPRPLQLVESTVRMVSSTASPVAQPPPAPPSASRGAARVEPVASGRGVPSYQAVCDCSWRGPVRAASHLADQDAGGHVRAFHRQRAAR